MVSMAINNNMLKSIPLSRFTEFLQQSGILQVEKAYYEVGWLRRAQDIRTEAVRTYPYDVFSQSKVISTEKPEDTGKLPQELNILPILDNLSTDLDMFGEAYALYETNRFGKNGAWRRLHPKSITIELDESTGELEGFTRQLGGKSLYFEPDELLYLWMPNVSAEIGAGKGVTQSALTPATAIHHIDKFQSAFFEQGALNPSLVNIKGFASQPEAEQQRIRTRFRRFLTGIKNAFSMTPVDGDVSIHNLMQPLRDMAMDTLSNQKREDVLSAMGVPHSMVMSNASNFATAQQDKLNFYDNTINGHVGLLQSQLNERLFNPNGYSLVFVKERLEVYQQSEAEKATKLSNQLDRAVIDVKEYREQMNLAPNERLESIFYERLESQMNSEDGSRVDEAVSRLQLNPTGESNDDSGDVKAVSLVIDIEDNLPTQHLDLWEKKAFKRFNEGKPDKALDFTSDVINPLQHQSIVEALEIAKTADDVKHIFKEARYTAPLWADY